MIVEIFNHTEEAQKRLLSQYSDSNINNLIKAFVDPLQALEDAVFDCNTKRALSSSFGQQLDNLGEIIGLARIPGLSDSDYLLYLYGEIGTNQSDGTMNQIMAIYQNFTDTTSYLNITESFPAQINIESGFTFPSTAVHDLVITLVQKALGAGILLNSIVHHTANPFQFDIGAGWDDGSGTVGGVWQ